MSEDISKFVIRIPSSLHESIKKFADIDDRSMNSYIIKILEDHVQQKSVSSSIKSGNYDLSEETINMIIYDIMGKRYKSKNTSDDK